MTQRQFPLAHSRLRKCPRHEDGSILPRRTARADEEYHVLTALKSGLYLGEIFFAVDGLLVDLENPIAATQVDVVGKRSRLHILHDDASACRDVEALGHVWREFAHRDAKLILLGRALVFPAFTLVQPCRKRDKFGITVRKLTPDM